jgi:hypothetical protein
VLSWTHIVETGLLPISYQRHGRRVASHREGRLHSEEPTSDRRGATSTAPGTALRAAALLRRGCLGICRRYTRSRRTRNAAGTTGSRWDGGTRRTYPIIGQVGEAENQSTLLIELFSLLRGYFG